MKKRKVRWSKILLVVLACLSLGTVAHAAGSATTEVEIAIEGSEVVATNQGENDTKENVQSVQTGDEAKAGLYWIFGAMAAGMGGVLVWKKKKKGFVAVIALFLSLFLVNNSAYAAESTENVNVTIPSTISVSFDETGENSISDFEISNQSLVPITMEKVTVTECNDWTLCDAEEEIPVNTKKMAFLIEGQCLKADGNTLNIQVAESSSKNCDIHINRGAWTTSDATETALKLEFEYAIGTKEFQLSFDTSGSNEIVESRSVRNGEAVELPSIEREGYALAGWKDEEGNVYTEQFIMPIGDVTLTAVWKQSVAYALYIAGDYSLRFVRTADTMVAGGTYDGQTITAVYTGFEEDVYTSESKVPWYDKQYYNSSVVKKVIVEDEIKPKSTAHWFHWMYDCEEFDVEKLDMSNVTDMSYMFAWAGYDAKRFEQKGIDDLDVSNVTNMSYALAFTGSNAASVILDLSGWDVSNVTDMSYTFAGTGCFGSTFRLGDLSSWNVSNVTNMRSTFQQTGLLASNWQVDCRNWNVRKVTSYKFFNLEISSKVLAPTWVN